MARPYASFERHKTAVLPFTPVSGRNINTFDEAIRTLRNSILLTDFDRRLRTLLVTSSSPSEGKSTTAANLALAHAQQGRRTLLIDGDLRRPSIHRRFDISPTVGFSNVLTSGVPWRSVAGEQRRSSEAGPFCRSALRHGAQRI